MREACSDAKFDPDSYLRWEAEQSEKHEYLAGEVFAMVGARREHVVVTVALTTRLHNHLRDTRCQTFAADMKLHVAAADAYFYPDVMVSCDAQDRVADLAVSHPLLVIEVLSDATAAYDRGAKFAAYRRLESLEEYLLVDIDARQLELYRRAADHWLLFETREGAPSIRLESIALDLSAADTFADL